MCINYSISKGPSALLETAQLAEQKATVQCSAVQCVAVQYSIV